MLTRARLLSLLGTSVLLPQCGRGGGIRIASNNDVEDVILAEIYTAQIEKAELRVRRRPNFKDSSALTEAARAGSIDLYPQYTAKAITEILGLPPVHDSAKMMAILLREYRRRYGLTWLAVSAASASPALAVTKATAARYGLRTISQCIAVARELRFASDESFQSAANGLPFLERCYGTVAFRQTAKFPNPYQYRALSEGNADVCSARTVDPQIVAYDLALLIDDRRCWPPNHIAAVARMETLAANPQIGRTLTSIGARITDRALRMLNFKVQVQKRDVFGVASEFLY